MHRDKYQHNAFCWSCEIAGHDRVCILHPADSAKISSTDPESSADPADLFSHHIGRSNLSMERAPTTSEVRDLPSACTQTRHPGQDRTVRIPKKLMMCSHSTHARIPSRYRPETCKTQHALLSHGSSRQRHGACRLLVLSLNHRQFVDLSSDAQVEYYFSPRPVISTP